MDETKKPKTLEDFPKFTVSAVRKGETSPAGYTEFELHGQFDRVVADIDAYSFWLLFGDDGCLTATLKSLDEITIAAVLTTQELNEPRVMGLTLYYLRPYWQAFNVWMVLDKNWGWKKVQFQGVDAIAQDYEADEISIVADQPVKIWTKLEPVEGRSGTSRHYPAADQTSPPSSASRLIPSGWGHEHCDFCRSHINAGESGYCDPGDRWLCESCYERYVLPGDLAFVDEL
jgi:hypothetical protein